MAFSYDLFLLIPFRKPLGNIIDIVYLHEGFVVTLPSLLHEAIVGSCKRIDKVKRICALFGGKFSAEEVKHYI